VVGMSAPQWGETQHAFIVFQPGMSATDDELRDFVRSHLAHFKAPRGWHTVDELPKTATGKIQKFVLRGGAAAIARQ
jgi:fatty-acyl-CoA synthase